MEITYRILLIVQAILISLGISIIYRKLPLKYFLGGVVLLGLFESLIGFLQVAFQRSIGFYLLGEPRINVLQLNLALDNQLEGNNHVRQAAKARKVFEANPR